MISIFFNLALGIYATIDAEVYWNDPARQFLVGMCLMTALWCANDVLKGLRKL